jgi:cytochrome c biogenesis protein CcdA/glutaredoxin
VARRIAFVPAVVVLVGFLLAIAPATRGASAADPGDPIDRVALVIFYGEGCPYCAAELDWLEEFCGREPALEVEAVEVWHDEAGRQRFLEVAADMGFQASSVPTTILGDRVWVGFDDRVAAEIEGAVEAAVRSQGEPPPPPDQRAIVSVPFVGNIDVGGRSLLVATVVIGFVDGVNPCSLWVLTVLLALVLHSGSRTRVAIVGVVFLTVTALLYGLYIAGIYTALSYVGALVWIQRAVAVVILAMGVLQLKDFVRPGEGPSLSIPASRKPGLFHRMRGLAADDRGLPAVVLATAGLAVAVSLFETPCTLGLPVLWTNLVADRGVALAGVVLLFVVYLLVFLLDELLVFGAAVTTMRALKLQERHGRELKLVSGVMMVGLAAVLLIRPALMETVGGALAVFVAIATVVALVIAASRYAEGHRSRAHRGRSPAR